jgi:hypothetical protein
MKKLTVIGLLVVLAGCYNDKADKLYPVVPVAPGDPCDTTNKVVSYSSVNTILQSNCAKAGCHDAATAADGYNFAAYADVKRAADNQQLMGTIAHKPGFTPMPQGGDMLPACAIAQIQKWVNQGAPNN